MQEFSFERVINLLEPHIPEKLISPESFRKIKTSASILPSGLIQYTFGFERELGCNLPEADFLVSLNSSLDCRDSLDDIFKDEKISTDEVWESIKTIINKWQDTKNFIYHRLDYLWFEFDIRRGEYFTPGFFFAPMIYENSKYNKSEQYLEIFKRVFACFNLQPSENVKRLTDVIPEEVHIFQVGLLPARDKGLQRYCLSRVTRGNFEEILSKLDYSTNLSEAKSVFDWLCEFSDKVEIDIDLGDTPGTKFGFECYMNRGKDLISKWEKFLNEICSKRICSKEEVHNILKFPGVSSANIRDDLDYPMRLLFEMNSEYFFKRSIHHVKVVYEKGEELKAKVYLSVNLMKRKESNVR